MPLGAYRLANFTVGGGGAGGARTPSTISHSNSTSISVVTGKFSNALRYDTASANPESTITLPSGVTFGNTNATIEFWFKITGTLSGNLDILTLQGRKYRIQNTQGAFILCSQDLITVFDASLGSWTSNTFYHFAITSDGTTQKTYFNGSQTSSLTFNTSASDFRIGATTGSSFLTTTMDVDIDEVRVSKVVRYTSNFTPSTSAFVNDSDTVALFHMENTTENDDTA